MIIICLYHNHSSRVMNQFDLEFKKLFLVIYDIESSMRFRTIPASDCMCVKYIHIINIFSWQILLNGTEPLVQEIISGVIYLSHLLFIKLYQKA